MVLVVCVVLLAFGYSGLPFWPQGKTYDAYFTDAGGISPGNAVYVSGFKVGKVQSVGLAGDTAKVTFSVDRHVAVGDQSLAAIRTDTILGERSIAVSPAGSGKGDHHSAEPHHHAVHAGRRAGGPGSKREQPEQAAVRAGPATFLPTRCTMPPRTCAAHSTG